MFFLTTSTTSIGLIILGAVTWLILDATNTHFDNIDLRGNSRVLIVSPGSSRISINTVLSDSGGQIFIAPNQSISIFTQLSPCLVAYNSSVLAFGNKMGSEVVIHRTLHVFGKLDFRYSPSVQIGQYGGSFIMHPGSSPNQFNLKNFVINVNYQVNLLQDDDVKIINIAGGKFTMGTSSSFNCNAQLTLLANNVIVNGAMTAPTLTNAFWGPVSIGSSGSLDTKILSNSFSANDIVIHGSLSLRSANMSMNVNTVSVYGTLTVAGIVKLYDKNGDSNVNITVYQTGVFKILGNSGFNISEIGAGYIDIFGKLYSGVVKPSGGWNRLRVFQSGSMVAQFKDNLQIDTIEISGSLKVTSVANISGLTRIRTGSISLARGSTFILNSQKDTGVSIIRASNMEINGTFVGGRVNPLEGWDRVYVGPQGNFNLELSEELPTDEITVFGNFEVKNNVSFRGYTRERVRKVQVGTGASFILNSLKVGTSYLRITNVEIRGRFLPGKTSVVEGWDRLAVQSHGNMNVHFIGEFPVDDLEVTGTMQVANNLTIRGYTKQRTARVVINAGGSLTLNSLKIGTSYLRMSNVQISGQFLAGKASVVEGWDSLDVQSGGNMKVYFVGEFLVDDLEVTGIMEVINNVTIRGYTKQRTTRVVINTGGSLTLNSLKIGTSYLRMSNVQISGQFLAGKASVVEGWDSLDVRSGGNMKVYFVGEFLVDDLEVTGIMEVINNVTIRGYTKQRTTRVVINTGGSLTLNSQGDGTSYLRMSDVQIDGRFSTGKASVVEGWDRLDVQSHGNMNIYFIGEFLVDYLEVSGTLQVTNNVTIRGYTKERTGKVVVNSGALLKLNSQKSGISYLRMSIVEINGQFLIGDASTVEGWDRLFIKPQGIVKIKFTSDFQIDRVEVSGNLEVENTMIVRGFSENRTRDLIVNSGGSITLDSQKTSKVSVLHVYNVSINGQFQAETVSAGKGWNIFTVGSAGSMTVKFHNALHVDNVIISGSLVVSNEVKMLGFSYFKTSEFKLESGSSVKLMAGSYNVNCGEKKAYSELQVVQLSINGLFQASALSVHDGIDDFSILPDGNFQFYPVREFWFNHFNVNGKMTSYRDIIIEGRHNLPISHAQFGPRAVVLLKRCFNDSRIVADRVTVAGRLVTDLLTIGSNWKELTVTATGTFEFMPADTFNITKTVISGNWRSIKSFSDDKPLQGNTLVVNQGGVISLNYQQKLEDPTSGSIPSIIEMATSIAIHGRFEAGSVSMITNDLTVSINGRLSVDWGGYASGKGPGAGSAASAGSSGASHAGRGGKGAGVSCHKLPYGSIYTKGSWGSGGGHTGNLGGRGGGKVHLEVRQGVQLDGGIQASGEPGKVS